MLDQSRRRLESRPNDELAQIALTCLEESSKWNAIDVLRHRATREVLELAVMLAKSLSVDERVLGIDILAQLGVPERAIPEVCCTILQEILLFGDEPRALRSALIAISFHECPTSIPLICKWSRHYDDSVRQAVAVALAGNEHSFSIECMIQLSDDDVPLVRDWATFGLGTQLDLNTVQIRDALFHRTNDADEDTRGEALVGLARRNDLRVLEPLMRCLTAECVGTLVIEAAELFASDQILPELMALKSWWDLDPDLLKRAIKACRKPACDQ